MPNRHRQTLPRLAPIALILAILWPAAWQDLPAARSTGGSRPMILDRVQSEAENQSGPWLNDFDAARDLAAQTYKPLLVFYTSEGCSWCLRMKREVFADPAIAKLLENFHKVEIDIGNPGVAMEHGVRATPETRLLSSSGSLKAQRAGFVPVEDMEKLLRDMLNPAFLGPDENLVALARALSDGEIVEPEKWAEILEALGTEDGRKLLHPQLLKLDPFPREQFVDLLDHTRLAVRLGALEVLEELAGASFGFDPWQNPGEQTVPLKAWRQWAQDEAGKAGGRVFMALSARETRQVVEWLIADSHDLHQRAVRRLRDAGPSAREALLRFLQEERDLPELAKLKITEAIYALTLARTTSVDPFDLAHGLVFGNLDVRVESILQLKTLGPEVRGILVDLLKNPEPLVRETAIEALVENARHHAVDRLIAMLQEEHDVNVVIAILRGFGNMNSRKGLEQLEKFAQHRNEDLAIVALESIQTLNQADPDLLRKSLKDDRWRVRVAALKTAVALSKSDLEPEIVALVEDEDPFVQISAVQSVGELRLKSSAPALHKVFEKSPDLRGPVLQALVQMEADFPKNLLRTFKESSAETAQQILESLFNTRGVYLRSKHLSQALEVAQAAARRDNPDLTAQALRILAEKGMDDPVNRGLVLTALKTAPDPQKIALLQALSLTGLEQAVKSLGQAAAPPSSGQSGTATAPKNPSAVSRLLSSFSKVRSNAEDSAGNDNTPSAAGPTASVQDLVSQIASFLKADHPVNLRLAAASVLVRGGHQGARDFLLANLDKMTVEERGTLSYALGEMPLPTAMPLMQSLLRNPDETVRSRAAYLMRYSDTSADLIREIFETALAEDTPLTIQDIFAEPSERALPAAEFREIARRFLDDPRPAHKAFGAYLLRFHWHTDAANDIAPLLDLNDPHLRRTAWLAFGLADPDGFLARLPEIAADPSPVVREVAGLALNRAHERISWILPGPFEESDYEDREMLRTFRLSDEARAILEDLTKDPANTVRLEAGLCLLAYDAPLDFPAFLATLQSFPDRSQIITRISDLADYSKDWLRPEHGEILAFIDPDNFTEGELEVIHDKLGVTTDSAAQEDLLVFAERPEEALLLPQTTGAAAAQNAGAAGEAMTRATRLIFFHNPGCVECERAWEWIEQLTEAFPNVTVESINLQTSRGKQVNEALSSRFDVSDEKRLVAPAVFTSAGFLIADQLDPGRLGELLMESARAGEDQAARLEVAATELEAAGAQINQRFAGLTLGIVFGAGLLDGINPCAFATIIFFLSYLQLGRRPPIEIAQVGGAFITGVFLAYFLVGLGLTALLERLTFLEWFGTLLRWVLAAVTLVLLVLSIRDGILASRGRITEMSLQLPAFLKDRIRGVVRVGARHRMFVAAAFVSGLVISILELACTGQVYLPTIAFVVQQGQLSAIWFLLLYNLAFIIPLLIIFTLALLGMRHEALIQFQLKHTATVKFALAGLFAILLIGLLFGHHLQNLFV